MKMRNYKATNGFTFICCIGFMNIPQIAQKVFADDADESILRDQRLNQRDQRELAQLNYRNLNGASQRKFNPCLTASRKQGSDAAGIKNYFKLTPNKILASTLSCSSKTLLPGAMLVL